MSRAILPLTPAHRFDRREREQAWLVDKLWSEEAVGILGGEPKCCKSLFALHLALAVAGGQPMLGRFAVDRPGPVLFYAAEDAEHIVGDRVRRIAAGARVDLASAQLDFITAHALRLDRTQDADALDATVEAKRPRLVVLDPFVRLHRKDENHAGDIAPILDVLRCLQRRHHTAILVVHHARKGGGTRAGQALRGSSEFHAWDDCNLFLRWRADALVLSVEHRAAAAIDDLGLELQQDDDRLQLRVVERRCASNADGNTETPAAPADQVLACLRAADGPLTRARLRSAVGIRNATLGAVLGELCAHGIVERWPDGYACVPAMAAGDG